MKIWLVGAGYWGQKVLKALEKFKVTAQIIDTKNGQTINDIDDLSPVMLATPLWQHFDQCCVLLQRGHDIYVEKPMAETLEEVMQLRSLIRPGQVFMVGHIFQHHPQRHEIHKLISDGIIGEINHVSSRRMNWGIYQTQTDPVLSLGTHDISIVLDMLQKEDATVDHARDYYMTQGQKPDRVQWSGRCGTATFDCDVSWAWPVRIRETIITGSQGQIIWNQDTNSYQIGHHRIINNRAVLDEQIQTVNYTSYLTPLEHEIQHWIYCLRNRKDPDTGINQAAAVARVIKQVTGR
jgi:predicted dehydrogenase